MTMPPDAAAIARGLTTERAVEAVSIAVTSADTMGSREQAIRIMAALAALTGLTVTQLEDAAYWVDESTDYLEGAGIDGFKTPDPVAALLRVLAEALLAREADNAAS